MTRFAFGAKWGSPIRPPVLGSRSAAPGRHSVDAHQRGERSHADALGRQAEELAARDVKIELSVDAHRLIPW
jgi:hypothetical protein